MPKVEKSLPEGQLNKREYAGRPSVCRKCGALVGATETSCSLCGAPKNSVAEVQTKSPQPVYDHETMRFARALMTRPYIFTIVFIVANLFVFFLTMQAGAEQDPLVLVRYGAKLNSLIDHQHEWWRFVTPMFLHGGIAHVLMNMYGLWMLGPYVERLYGSAKFVFFWVVTGVAGVVASYLSVQPKMHGYGAVGRFLFKSQDSISVGASGALFGLIGVLFVFGIKFRHELPEGFKRAFGTGMLPMILLNIFIGYMIPVIDNAAHMGGLVSGALLALVVGYKRPGERAGVAIFWHILQVLALALVVVSFVMVARNFNNKSYDELSGALPASSLGGYDPRPYVKALNDARNAFHKALDEGNPSDLEEALKELEGTTPPDKKSGELHDKLKALLARAKEFAAAPRASKEQQRARERQRDALKVDFAAWEQEFDQWVESEGMKYRIVKKSPSTDNSTEDK